jgi:hypothetical protein
MVVILFTLLPCTSERHSRGVHKMAGSFLTQAVDTWLLQAPHAQRAALNITTPKVLPLTRHQPLTVRPSWSMDQRHLMATWEWMMCASLKMISPPALLDSTFLLLPRSRVSMIWMVFLAWAPQYQVTVLLSTKTWCSRMLLLGLKSVSLLLKRAKVLQSNLGALTPACSWEI